MKIVIEQDLAFRLLAYASATRNEFSGVGFCKRNKDEVRVYDFVLLNYGSYGYTEIPGKKLLPLMDRPDAENLKVWFH